MRATQGHLTDWYKSYGAIEIPKAPLSFVLPYAIFMDVMKHAATTIA